MLTSRTAVALALLLGTCGVACSSVDVPPAADGLAVEAGAKPSECSETGLEVPEPPNTLWRTPLDGVIHSVAADTSGSFLAGSALDSSVDVERGCPMFAVQVAKVDAQGNTIWTRTYGDRTCAGAAAVAAARNGDLVVVGNSPAPIDFGPCSMPAPGSFVVKLDGDGHPLWSRFITGASNLSQVGVDAVGQIIVAGTFYSDLDLGDEILHGDATEDILVMAWSPTGDLAWRKHVRDEGNSLLTGLAVSPAGDAVLAGVNDGVIDFGGGVLDAGGTRRRFLAKVDTAGAMVWGLALADGGDDIGPGCALAIDPLGDVVQVATRTNAFTSDAPGGTGRTSVLVTSKFSASGELSWSRELGGGCTSLADGLSVAIGSAGEIIAGGGLAGSIGTDAMSVTSSGYFDGVLVGLASNGDLSSIARFGDAASQSISALAIDPEGDLLVVSNAHLFKVRP